MWVYNDETDSMIQRDLTFVPGLYKIFDEILGKIYNLLIYACNILCRLRSQKDYKYGIIKCMYMYI